MLGQLDNIPYESSALSGQNLLPNENEAYAPAHSGRGHP